MALRYTLLLMLACSLTGCSQYTPRRSARISVVHDRGLPWFVKNGQFQDLGFLGRGMVNLVRGVPEAEARARTASHQVIAGLSLMLAGVVGANAGIIYAQARRDDDPTYRTQAGVQGLIAAGIAVAVTGVGFLYAAQTARYDAMNLYNDAVSLEEEAKAIHVPWTLQPRLAYHGPEAYQLAMYVLVEEPFPAPKTGAELEKALSARRPGSYQQMLMGGESAIRPARFEVSLGKRYTLCAMAAPASDPSPDDWSKKAVACRPIHVSVTPSEAEVIMNVVIPYGPLLEKQGGEGPASAPAAPSSPPDPGGP